MKTIGFERALMVLLFVLVLIVFSFAERDSKKLDRLYNTAEAAPKGEKSPTAQLSPPASPTISN